MDPRIWIHHCGTEATAELAYSDTDRDYYFPVCERCQRSLSTQDMRLIDFRKLPMMD